MMNRKLGQRPSLLAARKEKPCPQCGVVLTVDKYSRDKTSEDGYFACCKSCLRARSSRWYADPDKRAKILSDNKMWHKLNRCKATKRMVAYYKKRCAVDLGFRIGQKLKRKIVLALKLAGVKKSSKTRQLLGCSTDTARRHLESRFLPGMTWENHSVTGWHIDHIRPIASFDLTKPEEQLMCFNYRNLQPLWSVDNIRKGDKYEDKASDAKRAC